MEKMIILLCRQVGIYVFNFANFANHGKGGYAMKKGSLIFCFVILIVLSLSSNSFGIDLAIMTGGQKGTYYQFGLNLKELVKSRDIRLRVNNSTGSIENLYAVYQRPYTQMGIVQSDVLAFVSRLQSDLTLKRSA